MAWQSASSAGLTVVAYAGDCKTLLAFDFDSDARAQGLAGFTIRCQPKGQASFYLHNALRFRDPAAHAQVAGEPPQSSANAPLHKFRWLHVPGALHAGAEPPDTEYTYTVLPRYFDARQSLQPIDEAMGVSVTLEVGPLRKGSLALGFARGYTQSQAFTHHFGVQARLRPEGDELLFDTAAVAGTDPRGQPFTYAQAYEWLGFTARVQVLGFLDEVLADSSQFLDVFAYDLNEPDVCKALLKLAGEGRVRIILDNAALHHDAAKPTPEDRFEAAFRSAAVAPAALLRGHFARYAHDKVLISFNRERPLKALTGSTNFSVTGLYVNSNHVLVFDDETVARTYGELFNAVWQAGVQKKAYLETPFASGTRTFQRAALPPVEASFAPHADAEAQKNLDALVQRIDAEAGEPRNRSVLFAVMEVDRGNSPVYTVLQELHAQQSVFSYGISDSTAGVSLYKPGTREGLLVTGKPGRTRLPPPFDQVRYIGGVGHQVHHKFVVCGFSGPDPVVYCGSSNLALGGESANGDNLLAIRDADIATAFALEALGLVDHFHFLDTLDAKQKESGRVAPAHPSRAVAAEQAGWFLETTDAWTRPYLDSADLRCADRKLFAHPTGA